MLLLKIHHHCAWLLHPELQHYDCILQRKSYLMYLRTWPDQIRLGELHNRFYRVVFHLRQEMGCLLPMKYRHLLIRKDLEILFLRFHKYTCCYWSLRSFLNMLDQKWMILNQVWNKCLMHLKQNVLQDKSPVLH